MIKIVDCFLLFNELKMLEFRLTELNDYVHHFVIVEATRTHTGKPKPLYFQENKNKFSQFLHKIVYVVVENLPFYEQELLPHLEDGKQNDIFKLKAQQAWEREFVQRNSIVRGVSQLELSDSDCLIISDCDEIVNPKLLEQIKFHGGFSNIFKDENNRLLFSDPLTMPPLSEYDLGLVGLNMDFYYYNLECKNRTGWWFTKMVTYKVFKSFCIDPIYGDSFGNGISLEQLPDDFIFKKSLRTWTGAVDAIRRCDAKNAYFHNAGWHFSYFGGVDAIITKLKNFSHQEYNLAPNAEEVHLNPIKISESIQQHKDIHNSGFMHLEHIPITENNRLPKNYKLLL